MRAHAQDGHDGQDGRYEEQPGDGAGRGHGRGRRRGPGFGGPGFGSGPMGYGPGGGGFGGPGGPGAFRGRGRRGGFGRPGGWQQADLPDASDAQGWFTGRLPDGWFVSSPTVTVDRDEITVVGELAPVDGGESAAEGRIARWREDTREERMAIAQQAQARYGRTVSWGARIGETGRLFTHLSVPAMTRLRQPERQVLDTLVDAGVARSRSEALAWCVKLVGQHSEEWLQGLREAMSEVERLRTQGPDV